MTTIAKLSADLTADSGQFTAGMQQADKAMNNSKEQWSKNLSDSGSAFGSFEKYVQSAIVSIGLFLTATVGVAKLVNDFKDVNDSIQQVARASQNLGIPVEQLSALAFGARAAAVPFGDLEVAIKNLEKNLASAVADPSSAAAKALDTLHLSAEKLADETPIQAINDFADAFQQLQSPMEKQVVLSDLLGRSSEQLTTFFSQGSQGLRDNAAAAAEVGQVYSSTLAAKSLELNKSITELDETYKGFLTSLANNGGYDIAIAAINGLNYAAQNLSKNYNLIEQGKAISALSDEVESAQAGIRIAQETLANPSSNGRVELGIDSEAEAIKTATEDLAKYTQQLDDLKVKYARIGDNLNPPTSPFDQANTLVKSILSGGTPTLGAAVIPPPPAPPKPAAPDTTVSSLMDNLKAQNDQLEIQVDLYGQKADVIKRAQDEQRISDQLDAAGISLTDNQRQALNAYLDTQQTYNQQLEVLDAQKKLDAKADQERTQQANQLGEALETAFDDAVVSGQKLSDVLDTLLQQILKMVLNTQLIKPAGNALNNLISPGSGGGGVAGGSIFASIGSAISKLFSFDVGANEIPNNMLAKVHKGEMIIPKFDADAIRSGGSLASGGGDVSVNVTNNSTAQVSTATQQTANGVNINLLIDESVAKNIGQPGSKTNKALSAYGSRSIIRR